MYDLQQCAGAVGQTPLIRLNRMKERASAEILVKFEALNVGGSIKTRTALQHDRAGGKGRGYT